MEELEIRRQLFHIFCGFGVVGLIYYDLINYLMIFIFIVAFFAVSLLSKKIKIPVISWLLTQFDRPIDIKRLPGKGALYYLLGVFLAMFLFPKDITMAAIIVLALGDAIAPLVGQYGRIKHPLSEKKFLEGTIAGVFVAFVGAALFVNIYEAGFAAVIAMVVEGIDLRLGRQPINDNIVIPIVAGGVIWLLRLII
ncbi:SEC59/DGK1/VTE5 family protein [Candidatus Woesearchaeota archaeon]|nr:SEC59/DGK1/VTE5 family protein [Candidatus Woesearchaeota archaeon]